MMTSSAKRTLTGLDFNLAFLAALINADLGDCTENRREGKKLNQLAYLRVGMFNNGFTAVYTL